MKFQILLSILIFIKEAATSLKISSLECSEKDAKRCEDCYTHKSSLKPFIECIQKSVKEIVTYAGENDFESWIGCHNQMPSWDLRSYSILPKSMERIALQFENIPSGIEEAVLEIRWLSSRMRCTAATEWKGSISVIPNLNTTSKRRGKDLECVNDGGLKSGYEVQINFTEDFFNSTIDLPKGLLEEMSLTPITTISVGLQRPSDCDLWYFEVALFPAPIFPIDLKVKVKKYIIPQKAEGEKCCSSSDLKKVDWAHVHGDKNCVPSKICDHLINIFV